MIVSVPDKSVLEFDLEDEASILALCDEVYRREGRVDILVNNAFDRSNLAPLSSVTRQQLQNSMNVNLNGQLILSQAVIEKMISTGGGSIINISSMRGIDCPHFPFYPENFTNICFLSNS